jgi:hypothetical protein
MLGAAVAILLWLLPLQVNGLLRRTQNVFLDMNGFVLYFVVNILYPLFFLQTFSSIGQSPCDVAAELASVCTGGSACVILC